MKKIFIGIDFSKEKFDTTLIKAEGQGSGDFDPLYLRSKMRWNLDGSWLRVKG